MSEFESDSAGTPRRPPAIHVAFVNIFSVPFGVPPVEPALPAIHDTITVQSGTVQAVAIVGVVLAEAIVLYLGYGALAAIVEPSIRELLGGNSTWNPWD